MPVGTSVELLAIAEMGMGEAVSTPEDQRGWGPDAVTVNVGAGGQKGIALKLTGLGTKDGLDLKTRVRYRVK